MLLSVAVVAAVGSAADVSAALMMTISCDADAVPTHQ